MLAHIYGLSNPLRDVQELQQYVFQYQIELRRDGGVVQCARELGEQLVKRGVESFHKDDYDRAYKQAIALGGSMEQVHNVAGSIHEGDVDLLLLGKELIWLADVLPHAAMGNWEPYANTGTVARQQVRHVLPYMNVLKTDAGMQSIVKNARIQFSPLAEEQIILLASIIDN
ncbi:hypothetical protein KQI65_06935 [bacterium]|nr:hypothetical protein [bacterium]